MLLKEFGITISPEYETLPSPIIDDRTPFTLELVALWKKTHSPEAISNAVLANIHTNHGLGPISEADALQMVHDVVSRYTVDWLNESTARVIRNLHYQREYVDACARDGNLAARLLFSDPQTLNPGTVIIYDDLGFLKFRSPASTNSPYRIYFAYPMIYPQELLRELKSYLAHESAHMFRLQRTRKKGQVTLLDRLVHEGLAQTVQDGELFYANDDHIERNVGLWLPWTLRFCLTDPQDSEQNLALFDEISKSYESRGGTTSETETAYQVHKAQRITNPADKLGGIFFEEASIFYKVGLFLVKKILQTGGIQAVRSISGSPPVEMLRVYNQLGCQPAIDPKLLLLAEKTG